MNLPSNPSPAEIYEYYLGRNIADPWTRELLALAAPQSNERVLDLACGTGSVARQVAPLIGEGGHVIALEINPEMLAVSQTQAQPQGAAIEWLEGEATNLKLPDQESDLVLCQQGLQFFPDREAALRETHRVLKLSGRECISVWQSLHRHPLYEAMFTATARHLDVPDSDVDVAFSLSDSVELQRLLESAGFLNIEVRTLALEIRVPDAERFIAMSIAGAATYVLPFTRMAPLERKALEQAIHQETWKFVQRFRHGDHLVFQMETNIATAKR